MITHPFKTVLTLGTLFALLAAGTTPVVSASPGTGGAASPEAMAAAALKPFKQQLMSALVKGLKDGPASAITVCSELAPKIAGELSTAGVTIGRTSHRLRNPANAPEPWMAPLLEKYAADPGLDGPTLVPLPDGGHGYVEPITVRPACLACHGTEIDPEVKGQIADLYPDDRAHGFAAGDFRGLFWARIEPAE